MVDYYAILGLTKDASDSDIKAAFRKLAKQYHPDKNPNNPNTNALFEAILKAYSILINPHSRKRYDYGFSGQGKQAISPAPKRTKSTKERSVTPEDLKHRQYYQNYYKAKQQMDRSEEKNKVLYSDYKYVLFAAPMAVGLFMLVLSVCADQPEIEKPILNTKHEHHHQLITYLPNGDMPYHKYFGNTKTVNTKHTLRINNISGCEAIIVLLDQQTNTYLQHAYVQPFYAVTFSMLPATGVYWKCMIGKHWNQHQMVFQQQIIGGFDSLIQYQNWKQQPVFFNKRDTMKQEDLKLLPHKSEYKPYLSSSSYFFAK